MAVFLYGNRLLKDKYEIYDNDLDASVNKYVGYCIDWAFKTTKVK